MLRSNLFGSKKRLLAGFLILVNRHNHLLKVLTYLTIDGYTVLVCIRTHVAPFCSISEFLCLFVYWCTRAHSFVCDWQAYNLDIVMDKINSPWSLQVTALYEVLMAKWQTGRQLGMATWDQTKALSLGNPECFGPEAPILKFWETSQF